MAKRQSEHGFILKELVDAIEKYIAVHNEDPAPFVWTKTAEQILAKATRRKDISVTKH